MALFFAPDAFKDIQGSEIDRVNRKINWLWVNRLLVKHEPLRWSLSGYFKRRLGNYRIIYTYDEVLDEMVIHLVGLRDLIYQNVPH